MTARERATKDIHELHEKYYKGRKKASEKIPGISGKGVVASRNDLMLKAKTIGIKNFRVLNKAELEAVLKEGADVEKIVKGAVLRWRSGWKKKAAVITAILFMSCQMAFANTDTEIVNAIYKAEGSEKATYLYGIRSVEYDTPEEARRICFNTVRNNRVRFINQTKYKDYLEFLASRYCPVDCDNDTGTNKYWLKNVRYFLKKNKGD